MIACLISTLVNSTDKSPATSYFCNFSFDGEGTFFKIGVYILFKDVFCELPLEATCSFSLVESPFGTEGVLEEVIKAVRSGFDFLYSGSVLHEVSARTIIPPIITFLEIICFA